MTSWRCPSLETLINCPDGSVRIEATASLGTLDALAFKNPTGSIVTVIYNSDSSAKKMILALAPRGCSSTFPPTAGPPWFVDGRSGRARPRIKTRLLLGHWPAVPTWRPSLAS
jgi:hypothetical protein